jgi:hypothetical protein
VTLRIVSVLLGLVVAVLLAEAAMRLLGIESSTLRTKRHLRRRDGARVTAMQPTPISNSSPRPT